MQAFFTSVFLRWLVFHRTAQPQEPLWSRLADTLQRLPDNNLCGYATSLLEAISQIADLAAWKTSRAAAGVLSTLELAKRAHAIEERVGPFVEVDRRRLLDHDDKTRSINRQNGGTEPPLAPAHYYHWGCSCCFCSKAKATYTAASTTPACPLHAYWQALANALANALLARSAQIFLYIVVSGPNPRLLEIQAVVRGGVQLLRQWEKHEEMMGQMALSWPLAVMTSMAVGVEEREVLSSALIACGRMWANPNEQGQIEIGQALPFQSMEIFSLKSRDNCCYQPSLRRSRILYWTCSERWKTWKRHFGFLSFGMTARFHISFGLKYCCIAPDTARLQGILCRVVAID